MELTDRQAATILHGLRIIQAQGRIEGCAAGDCSHFEFVSELTNEEIDELCEGINFGDYDQPKPKPTKRKSAKLPMFSDHCQMCGKRNRLEYGLNPAGEIQTLCGECRIGSMLLLAEACKKNGLLLNSLSECMNTMQTLSEYLQETHESELQNNHGGDGRAGCSYCEVIKEVSTVYKGLLKQLAVTHV